MKIKVRADLCCGVRVCMKVAPGVYQRNEQGYNAMDGTDVPPGQEEAARRGAAQCPENAIELLEVEVR